MKQNKLLLIASPGGHFVQLSLLAEGLQDVAIVAVCSYEKKPSFMPALQYEVVPDFNRENVYRVFGVILKCRKILQRVQPDLVVTTGAAPGLVMVLVARLSGIKTVWIDSIANSRKLSFSGRIAKFFGVKVLSQWQHVAEENNVRYEGRVI